MGIMSFGEKPTTSADDSKALAAFQEYLHVELGEKQPRTMATLMAVAHYLTYRGDIRPREYNDGNPSSFARLRRLVNEKMDDDEMLAAEARAFAASRAEATAPPSPPEELDEGPSHVGREKKRREGKKSGASQGPKKRKAARPTADESEALNDLDALGMEAALGIDVDLETFKPEFEERLGTITGGKLKKSPAKSDPLGELVDAYIKAILDTVTYEGDKGYIKKLNAARTALKAELEPRMPNAAAKSEFQAWVPQYETTVRREYGALRRMDQEPGDLW